MIISYNHSILPVLPQIEERKEYYGIPIYPTLNFDGTDVVFEPNANAYDTTFNQHIQTARSAIPVYNLELNGTATASSGNLHVKIAPADTFQYDSVYAFVAVCQDSVRGDLGGWFNYVIRQFYQFPISLMFPDSLDTTLTFTHSIPVDKMRGVLFVQNLQTKKVLQAIKTEF